MLGVVGSEKVGELSGDDDSVMKTSAGEGLAVEPDHQPKRLLKNLKGAIGISCLDSTVSSTATEVSRWRLFSLVGNLRSHNVALVLAS